MKSYSQAGQDIFVQRLCRYGQFLDIGAGGRSISNTLALEEAGWQSGICIDNSPEAQADHAGRNSRFILGDATRIDYNFLPMGMQYLSLDIDGATLDAMRRVFEAPAQTRFSILTCEHDFYSRGELLRTPMLELLRSKGYDILCSDVCHEGQSFEIWAVAPDLVDMTVAEKFRRDKPTDWRAILNVD